MQVYLVNGSPNQHGCTDRALEEVKTQLEAEGVGAKIYWIGKTVQGCTACDACDALGRCVFDDKVAAFAELAKNADGFVFGSPVYYGGAAGGMVSYLNRLFYSSGEVFRNKAAASVVSCRRGGATETFGEMNMHYLMNNMLVVGSQYWNQVHGLRREDVEQDLEGLQTMRTLARNMAWALKCLQAGKKAGVELPETEPPVATNFIR